jgi:hypothetical protein
MTSSGDTPGGALPKIFGRGAPCVVRKLTQSDLKLSKKRGSNGSKMPKMGVKKIGIDKKM